MIIFIDTNIFYNHYFFENPHFKYLFNFLNNESHTLLISKLVTEEIENIRRREINSILEEINKNFKLLNKKIQHNIRFDTSFKEQDNYNFERLLKMHVDSLKILDYKTVNQEEIVKKALGVLRPFQEGEKGYRDTLIWLSFLDYIKENKIKDQIVFISANKNDFFIKKDNCISFHPDLQDDIKNREIITSIMPYETLFSFVQSSIDKTLHAIDDFDHDFDDFLEEEGQFYLETFDYKNSTFFFKRIPAFTVKFSHIINVEVSINEGVEDPKILEKTKLNDNELYLNYRFNLRRVSITLEVFKDDYYQHKSEIEAHFYNVELFDDTAFITILTRPYFDVSFIYNIKDEIAGNFLVDTIYFG